MTAASQGDPGPKHIDLYGNIYEVPDFTMKQIYAAIPAHCFRPSTARGLGYVVRDLTLLGSLTWITYNYTPMLPNVALRTMVYTLYTVIAGMIMTGIWILAHECGHGAFSPSKKVNNLVGFVLHSALLVPYYSWKISHSHHHKATGDLQRDTVYVPHSREYLIKSTFGQDSHPHSFTELTEDAPIITLWHCLLFQVFGWPLYMLDNLSGQKGASGFPQHSHYWFGADSALYKESELFSVFLSDLGVAITCIGLYVAAQIFSVWAIFVFYGIPYLWLNQWVVVITYLQHTDPTLPHFTHSTWTFACGASATIDRSFCLGPLDIDKHLFHGIVGTHVLHHLCSSIPFYHAYEATDAVRTVMGKHYREDRDTSLMKALFRTVRDCQFVEEGEGMEGSGVFFFRNLHGRGVKPRDVALGEGMSVWDGHLPRSWNVDIKQRKGNERDRWEWRGLMKFLW